MFASYEARKGVGGACCPDASDAGRHGSRHGRARPRVPKGTVHGPRRAARKGVQATEAPAPVRKRRAVPGNPDPPPEQTPREPRRPGRGVPSTPQPPWTGSSRTSRGAGGWTGSHLTVPFPRAGSLGTGRRCFRGALGETPSKQVVCTFLPRLSSVAGSGVGWCPAVHTAER